jgi:hypothetical protein
VDFPVTALASRVLSNTSNALNSFVSDSIHPIASLRHGFRGLKVDRTSLPSNQSAHWNEYVRTVGFKPAEVCQVDAVLQVHTSGLERRYQTFLQRGTISFGDSSLFENPVTQRRTCCRARHVAIIKTVQVDACINELLSTGNIVSSSLDYHMVSELVPE